MGRFELAIARWSDAGRRAGNEDALGCGTAGPFTHAVVCDGVGGHAHGAEAARRSVETIDAVLSAAPRFDAPALRAALLAAHVDLGRFQRQACGDERMHTTAVVLWIDTRHERALWSHVGDSRLYRMRHGAVERLTADDSVVQRMVESGVLNARQAETHPLKNRLLAALGMQGTVEPSTAPAPEPLLDGDAFLLCTDGWWGALDDAEIAETALQADTPEAWLATMRDRIESRARADQDNFSAVAVWVSDPLEDTQGLDG